MEGELGLGSVLSNFDGTNAFGATRSDLLITTSQQAAMEKDRMFAAISLQHGNMTLQARDGPVTLMGSSGAQMGLTLAPRDFNDCYNPRVQQWLQRLRTVDSTNSWLEAINPRAPSQKLVDLSCATFMDHISRIQLFAAPPSVAEVVFKMNRTHSFLEESPSGGDWTLNASKTANVIAMRREGASATSRGLEDKKRGLQGVACSEACLLGPYLKANGNITANGSCLQRMEAGRTILEGQRPQEGQASHAHLLRARRCAVGIE